MTREDLDAKADSLASRARGGDIEAFNELCRMLRDDVWRYCYALLDDREQAFDAGQDTFVRLVRAISTWRGDAPIRVFVLVLARRAVADLIRANQRRRRSIPVDQTPEHPRPAETGTVELAELINLLDDDQRQAFVLTSVLGLAYEEAAEIAGVAVGTIRSRVARARKRLAVALDQAERT